MTRPATAALLASLAPAALPAPLAAELPAPALLRALAGTPPAVLAPRQPGWPGAVRPISPGGAEVPGIPAAGPLDDGIRLSPEEAERIGRLIWRNESGGTVDGLTHWNAGEDFASLGIAHFLWYPEGRGGPFMESFPALRDYLRARGAAVPRWLAEARGCPWPDRAAFFGDFRSPRMNELRDLLEATVDLQARFAADRLEAALPKLLAGARPEARAAIRSRFYAAAAHSRGVYALVDYVNFKGEGLSPSERYQGQGWGLLQVLEGMADAPAGERAVEAFAASARAVLERRVRLSPPERGEARWLKGWLQRVETYLEQVADGP